MDIFLLITGFLLVIAGVIGCILPAIPGPPLSYIGLLLLHFTSRVDLTTFTLIYMAVLVIIVTILDYLVPIWGTKLSGGSKWGMRGSAIGLILGLFFGVIGVFLFPFIGALTGELLYQYNINKNNNFSISFRAAVGSFFGLMLGVVFKLAVCCFIVFIYIKETIINFF
ncbi:MAG: DUF456 domain-containing protein [Bacteroidales bacterium]|jgi:uncharacterized protein YqgC (DUF456 family)|nr:DUF456 domain-containing protein [Bacteroidales bacterium]